MTNSYAHRPAPLSLLYGVNIQKTCTPCADNVKEYRKRRMLHCINDMTATENKTQNWMQINDALPSPGAPEKSGRRF